MDLFSKTVGSFVRHGSRGCSSSSGESAPAVRWLPEGFSELLRNVDEESCVLLQNNGVLPLKRNTEVAVFGRCQLDWQCGAFDSASAYCPDKRPDLIQELLLAGQPLNRMLLDSYASWIDANPAAMYRKERHSGCLEEMPLDESVIRNAAQTSRTALVVIGRRTAGMSEPEPVPGSYYLSEDERNMLNQVTSVFQEVAVVLHSQICMDMAWTEDYGNRISALLLVCSGGDGSAAAVSDILCGNCCPSGRLQHTIARYYVDYPGIRSSESRPSPESLYTGYRFFDRFSPKSVLFPLGYGLSYTSFETIPEDFSHTGGDVSVSVRVKNIGCMPGKEVVQLWCSAPAGTLEKPLKVLCAFFKTSVLNPGEEETILLRCSERDFSSYDVQRHAFILETGIYHFSIGEYALGSFCLYRNKTTASVSPADLERENRTPLPKAVSPSPFSRSGTAVQFDDVISGKLSMHAFVSALSRDALSDLTRGTKGRKTSSPDGPSSACFGGYTSELQSRGIPRLLCADSSDSSYIWSIIPSGMALGCTWNVKLTASLYEKFADLMHHFGASVYFGPNVNLFRYPLASDNAELLSEDPLLAGQIAAAAVRGLQRGGCAGCPGPFLFQSSGGKTVSGDYTAPEQIIREIDLRSFEICIHESSPMALRIYSGRISRVWAGCGKDLVRSVLRCDWSWDGVVIAETPPSYLRSSEFSLVRRGDLRLLSGADLLIPGSPRLSVQGYRISGGLLENLDASEERTFPELQQSAARILQLIAKLRHFHRL